MPEKKTTPEIAEYAVNLADVTRYYQNGRLNPVKITLDPVLSETWITAEDRLDGAAVLLDCPRERAAAILAVIRKKIPKNLLRFYVRFEGRTSWERV